MVLIRHHAYRPVAAGAACLAVAAAAAVPAAGAASRSSRSSHSPRSQTTVTIRIEGAKRTLLPARQTVVPRHGSVTHSGAPKGACPAASAAGVLQNVTHGNWKGSWSTKYHDYLITSILGDTESGKRSYWEILVNNVQASAGACALKLRRGDALVFAAVPLSGPGEVLAVRAPRMARHGRPFVVTVVAYSPKGIAKPLAGATVTGAGTSATTNAKGQAKLTSSRRGTVRISASRTGDVRAVPVRVQVR